MTECFEKVPHFWRKLSPSDVSAQMISIQTSKLNSASVILGDNSSRRSGSFDIMFLINRGTIPHSQQLWTRVPNLSDPMIPLSGPSSASRVLSELVPQRVARIRSCTLKLHIHMCSSHTWIHTVGMYTWYCSHITRTNTTAIHYISYIPDFCILL